MNPLFIRPFFFNVFNMRSLRVEGITLAGGGKRLKISTLSAFCPNVIDVESCSDILGAAFSAYQSS